jgi:hypothetical protein
MRWKALLTFTSLLCIAAAAALWFTKPTQEQFGTFLESQHISGVLVVSVNTHRFWYSEYGYYDGLTVHAYKGMLGHFYELKTTPETASRSDKRTNP